MFAFLDAGGLFNADSVTMCLKTQERFGTEEAVSADALAPHHALKEERPVAVLDLAECADRCQRVTYKLSIHRHKTCATRKYGELFEGRSIAHIEPRTKHE